jgi:CubicO group peptidase (beta-lactamase class C family)
MRQWHVPGLALGVVKDGQVVFAKGYGYRDVEHMQPVTTRTVMAIGSNSKSFTVMLLGMLAEDRKLSWDKPLRDYLPDFQLWDPYATRELTPRDLVTHRSGLPRHDLLWYGRAFTRKELYQRLRYLEPTTSFRGRYQYQNLMFMTAGYLTEQLTGRTWDDLIRERIFTPLGMSRSNTSVADSPRAEDYALPYAWRDSLLVEVPFRSLDAIAPAGAINSTIEDMLKYLELRLDSGRVGDRRLYQASTEARMQAPVSVSDGAGPDYPELGPSTYALGVGVTTYRGHKVVQHGGGIDGFSSGMSWLPHDRLGVIVLTNLGGTNAASIVSRYLYDRFLGLTPVDWVGRQKKLDSENTVRADSVRKAREAERKPGTTPSHPLSEYTGSYEHPGYGRLTISSTGTGLELGLDSHRVPLLPFHYDIWELDGRSTAVPISGRVTFYLNKKGEVDRIAVPLEPALADIVFTRVPR